MTRGVRGDLRRVVESGPRLAEPQFYNAVAMDPVSSFRGALRTLNQMRDAGVIEQYAIAGAIAIVFWSEPVPTYDLDVLVFLPPAAGPLVSLAPIYRWADEHGYPAEDEHVVIEGVPTQFLPSPNALADEALESAATFDYEGVQVRVVRPEYLIALYSVPEARTPKRRERAAMLLESADLNRGGLDDILRRHDLTLV